MIGDNPETDILGGKKIGAITFQKLHKGITLGKGSKMPDYGFHNFKDLYNLCESII